MYLDFPDVKKTFDIIDHWTMLKKIIGKRAPVHLVNILKLCYQQQQCAIRWGSQHRTRFEEKLDETTNFLSTILDLQ